MYILELTRLQMLKSCAPRASRTITRSSIGSSVMLRIAISFLERVVAGKVGYRVLEQSVCSSGTRQPGHNGVGYNNV